MAKLLLFLGLGTLGIGLWQLAGFIDFIHILATQTNLPIYSDKNVPFSSVFWYFTTTFELIFGIAFIFYSALKLVIPSKRYYFFTLYLILGVGVSIIYIWFFSSDVDLVFSPGGDIINTSIKTTSLIFPLIIGAVLLYFIFNVLGLLLKSFKSRGIIKKKETQLSVANLLFLIFFIAYVMAGTSVYKLVMRIGEIGSIIVMYYALREVQEKQERERPKKEIKVEEGLFRVVERPDVITEEEVTISKEKKICLVCKGKVWSFSFICPECETFYCEKCARAIMELENVCWACDQPLDASRPHKPYKKKEIAQDDSKFKI